MTDKLTTTDKGALAKAETSMVRPDYVAKSHRGINFTKKDTNMARVALAQALSPEVTEGDPAMIAGLKPGDLFNTKTKEIYGRELLVQIVRRDNPRAMQFNRIEDGGGVADPDVPLNDPRLKWGADGEKPIATLFLDYLALTLPADKPFEERLVALSFKSSGIKVAKDLNGLIAFRNADIWAGVYKITTDTKLVPKPHKIYKVLNAGWVSKDDFALGEEMFEAVKDMDVVIEHTAPMPYEDPDSFDPSKMSAATDM